MSINWNIPDKLIQDSFNQVVDEFHQEQQVQLASEKWKWNRQTLRKNGQIVDSPRDIIDTGELFNSLEVQKISETEVIYSYDVPYAMVVHEGNVLGNGTELPARPWVDEAIKDYQPIESFEEILKDKL